MTTFKQRLHDDLIVNLKAHNELETTTLRGVLGAIQYEEKRRSDGAEFNDADVLKFLGSEVKKRRDTAETFASVGSTDRAARETSEADFLSTYLPTRLTDAEVEILVDEVLISFPEANLQNFGAIMKEVVAKVNGRADGKIVSSLVRTRIS